MTEGRRSLDSLKPGESGTVVTIEAISPRIRQRLLEMGVTKGTTVHLVRFAPLGDPLEISIRGYRLSLRREEAESIVIEKKRSPIDADER
jgi:ferrous iron transport protein A